MKDNADYPTPSPSNVAHRNLLHYQQHGDVANIRATKDLDLHVPKIQQHMRAPNNNPTLPPCFENANMIYKPLPPVPPPARNALPPKRVPQIPQNSPPLQHCPLSDRKGFPNDNSLHCDNVAESIRQYNLNDNLASESRSAHLKAHQLQLSPEKYDYIMQNLQLDNMDEVVFPEDVKTIDDSRQNVTANGMRLNKPSLANIKNVTALKDLGIPPEEVLELDRKLEQEKRDEVRSYFVSIINCFFR